MSKKILVAEDNEKNRKLIRDVLRYYGYDVIETENGAECVETAKEHLPDLILLDIQMPVMDGFRAIKVLKEMPETKHIKVIALTSFAMVGDREKILEAGFDDYIAKPINTRQLPLTIKQHLGDG
ncbi:polar-differentiation response regulator DivK [bacterium BMS3Abin07]|nr:polar-differentiation response regulator DivK [bacterium BMS3Abin07]HDZ62402.1 response regulator [Nitrospirota bacterium]